MENVIVTPKKMLKISELFSLSFKIYDNKFWLLMGLVFVPFLPSLLFMLEMWYGFLNILLAIIYLIVLFFITIFAGILSKIALSLVVKDNLAEFSIFAMLKKALAYFKSYLWISILGGVLIMIGFMLFIIPGLIFAIYWSMVTWVFLDQGIKGEAALKQSKALVKGYWWAVFGRLAIPLFIFIIIIMIPSSFMEPKSQAANTYSFVTQIISMVLTPFFTAYVFNIYKNLKEIKA